MPEAAVHIVQAETPQQIAAARDLLARYASSLGWDLTSGWIAEEMAELPGPYRPPAGALLLASIDGEPAGVLGLQVVPAAARAKGVDVTRSGELKRLFVQPEFRGHGIGRALLVRAEDEARARGYEAALLTTNAGMFPLAQSLYDALGYVETTPYRTDMPYEGIRWMRKPL